MFYKFYLVHSWIPCPISRVNTVVKSSKTNLLGNKNHGKCFLWFSYISVELQAEILQLKNELVYRHFAKFYLSFRKHRWQYFYCFSWLSVLVYLFDSSQLTQALTNPVCAYMNYIWITPNHKFCTLMNVPEQTFPGSWCTKQSYLCSPSHILESCYRLWK